jgi:hypothetical protein
MEGWSHLACHQDSRLSGEYLYKTATILIKHVIPSVILFPSLSAMYPEPIAPKKPPIEDAVLNAICHPALTMY